MPNLTIYKEPMPGRHYVIGADPAEGNPNSDDSAGNVLDADTWEEVAVFAGKWEPRVFGRFIDQGERAPMRRGQLCEVYRKIGA